MAAIVLTAVSDHSPLAVSPVVQKAARMKFVDAYSTGTSFSEETTAAGEQCNSPCIFQFVCKGADKMKAMRSSPDSITQSTPSYTAIQM